jgi:hypothetical protein
MKGVASVRLSLLSEGHKWMLTELGFKERNEVKSSGNVMPSVQRPAACWKTAVRFFLFPAIGATHRWVLGVLYFGVKRPERANCAEVKNAWSYTATGHTSSWPCA